MNRRAIFSAVLIIAFTTPLFSIQSESHEQDDYRITVLESDGNKLRILFELMDYRLSEKVTDGERFSRIVMSGCGEANLSGKPRLPVVSKAFALPGDLGAKLEIKDVRLEYLKDILPLEACIGDSKVGKYEPANSSDETEEVFPARLAALSRPVIARSLRFSALDIFPFRYYPAERRLEIVRRLELEITFLPGRGENPRLSQRKIPSSSFMNTVCPQLLNPDLLDQSGEDFGHGGYLFILPSPYYTQFIQGLVDWKYQQGFPVSIGCMNEIGNSAESLKDYIEDAYYNWEIPPEYVVLVGDVGGSISIPCFYYDVTPHVEAPTDHEYTLLEGDDYFPDLQIGRLSVETSTQLTAIVNKIVNYESNPYTGDNWFERGLLIADTSALQSLSVMQWAKDLMLDYGYQEIDTVFYFSYMPTALTAASINGGVGVLNFRGWEDWGGWSISHINALSNNNKTPLVFGCASGTNNILSTDCLGEAWLRAGTSSVPKGAIACMGPSTGNTWSKWDGTLDQGMVWGLYHENIYRASPLLNRGKFELWLNFPLNRGPGNVTNSVECYYYIYTLLGDPGLSIWSREPETIGAIHPERIPIGCNFVEIIAGTHQERLADGYASLVKNEEVFSAGFTDENGFITLPVDSATAGQMTLTITAPNHRPYQTEIEVYEARGYIGFNDITIDDDSLGASAGNGDGNLNPGETVELTISLKNFGRTAISGVRARISCDNPLINITEPMRAYGNFAPGGIIENADPFVMEVAAACPDLLEIVLDILAADNQNHRFESQCPLMISAPDIEITGYSFPQLQPDTLLYPGGDSDFILNIQNTGGDSWEGLSCTAICTVAGVTMDDTVSVFPSCLPGGEVSNESDPFHISVERLFFPGGQIQLSFRFLRADGWADTVELALEVGSPCIFDPVMPMDGYGYYCFDDTDVGYDQTPQYEWREIDPNFGGSGTLIELVDPIANRGDSRVISLPEVFHFRHYGEECNQITVCSNGWLSCGASPVWDFRNKPIPAAGEPEGMIAPLWDDLMLTGECGVYHYYDIGDDAFIVEWSRLRNSFGNHIETFEVVLWDADIYQTPTGDSPISFLYHTISDVDTQYNWSTVGILNNEADAGLQYLFSGIYSPGANTLEDGRALYFTTDPASRIGPPILEYSPDNFSFSLHPGGGTVDSLMISNLGEADLTYQLNVSLWAPEGSGGPDQFGYIWIDSDESGGGTYDWVDITQTGFEIIYEHNDSTSADMPLGFQFPFYGNLFNSIIVSANGWCSFTSHSNAYSNTILPSYSAPENLVAGFWDDLDPLIGEGHVYIWGNQVDSVVVSFIDIRRWGSGFGQFTYQVILEDNGRMTFQYQSMEGNTTSATIGIQNDTRNIGLTVVYNQSYVHNNLRIDIQRPWLTIEQNSGAVPSGETHYITVEADAGDLPAGSYGCDITLLANDPGSISQDIPASLEVTPGFNSVSGLMVSTDGEAIILTWQPYAEGAIYRILRSDSPGFDDSQATFIGQTKSTCYQDNSAVDGNAYFYRVMVLPNSNAGD